MDPIVSYLLAFVVAFWPQVQASPRQMREVAAIAKEVAALPTDAGHKLRLMNVAALESNFNHAAIGPDGERGPWQILGGTDYSAAEALRRMTEQGMVAYVGCRHLDDAVVVQGTATTCRALVAHRIDRADLYRMAFDPPVEPGSSLLARNP